MVAQPAAAQVVVSGGPFANILRFGGYSSRSPSIYDENLSGTTSGVLIGIGGVIASHAVVQLEIAIPKELHTDILPYRALYPSPPPPYTTRRSVDYRTRHVSIMAGYQTGQKHRVRAAMLGGVMFIEEEVRSLTTYPPQQSLVLPSDNTNTAKRTAPVFGFDLSCAITSHLSVVPQIRMYKSSPVSGYGSIGLWPGVSARWTF